jgi:hypothetical protein
VNRQRDGIDWWLLALALTGAVVMWVMLAR